MAEPTLEVSMHPATEVAADLLAVPVFEGRKPGPGTAEVASALGIDLRDVLRRNGITGKAGETLLLPVADGIRAGAVLLLGVGGSSSAGIDAVRDGGMRLGAASRGYRRVATTLARIAEPEDEAARALAEGSLLGSYRFDGRRTEPGPRTERLTSLTDRAGDARRGLARGIVVGSVTNLVRDLVNAPAQDATPELLAAEARRLGDAAGLVLREWSSEELEADGFGGILGVGRGSANRPRMVELSYEGAGDATPIAVTGKGVTFDSGGLTLKDQDEMEWMRSDMAGAAAALGTILAAARLELAVNLIAVLPFAENLPGGNAIRPGDVVRHRGGLTSEVLDTDAEGRVLLADAIAYLTERRPAAILDSATLTDASGLGPDLWAAMGTDPSLVRDLVDAGLASGDRGWEVPLWAPYRKLIDSPVADLKNVGDDGVDSAILAGLFLRDFAGDIPWVHVDSGSTAWVEHASDLWPEGATGSPTRASVRYLESLVDRS